jgi:hypothetical protein
MTLFGAAPPIAVHHVTCGAPEAARTACGVRTIRADHLPESGSRMSASGASWCQDAPAAGQKVIEADRRICEATVRRILRARRFRRAPRNARARPHQHALPSGMTTTIRPAYT